MNKQQLPRSNRTTPATPGAVLATLVTLLFTSGASASAIPASASGTHAATASAAPASASQLAEARAQYGALPIAFEENRGQAEAAVRFLSRGPGYGLFLTPSEAVLSLRGADKTAAFRGGIGQPGVAHADDAVEIATIRLSFDGANRAPAMRGVDAQAASTNYFRGATALRDVSNFAKVRYEDLYPGVDLVYYGTQQGQLEYDFVVAPGSDPSRIALDFAGVRSLRVDAAGDLVLGTAVGDVVQHAPVVYQEVAGERRAIAASYARLGARKIGFRLGDYDRSRELVIDPVLVYSTFHGGSLGDRGNDIAIDGSGNAYVVGTANSSNFPSLKGFDNTKTDSSSDVFVSKFSPTGALVYSTFLGGIGTDEGAGIAVDASGNAYVTGRTTSLDFPIANAYQSTLGGSQDAFLVKLNASGNALVFSTFLGGNANPNGASFTGEFGYAVAVDASNSAYVTGYAVSTNFPVVNAFQSTGGGAKDDVFVTKFAANGASLVYSTYLGGSDFDEGYNIAVDSAGSAYVTGITGSSNFPLANARQGLYGSNQDAFLTKLSPAGNSLVYSTFIGGFAQDVGYGIAVDSSGNAYVAGVTSSGNFPVSGQIQSFNNGGTVAASDAFVAKFNAAGNTVAYATWLGGSGNESGIGLAIDPSGNAYVVGQTASTNFPTASPIQASNNGGGDVFLTKLTASGNAMVYSTYLGGDKDDVGNDIAVNSAGDAFITGQTASTSFPTASPRQASNAGSSDAFVTRISTSSDVSISISDASVTEGNSGTVNAVFTVSLSKVAAGTVSFTAATANGTATAGSDYTATTLTGQTIAAGQLTRTITVPVVGDTVGEANETFFVNLSAVTGAVVADGQGAGTINNDDAVVSPTLSINDMSVAEGNAGTSIMTFTVSLSPTAANTVGFDIATANGSATAGSDYVASALSGQTIAAGQSSKTFSVTINGDTAVEPNENFFVNLSNPTGGALIGDGQGQGTINNDDSATVPVLTVADASVTEGNAGTSSMTFTVSLSQATQVAVGFSVFTSNNTAAAGSDYVALNLTGQTIPAGETSKSFVVTINGDTTQEGNETFFFNVGSVTNATVGDGQAVGTINNDDSAVLPALSINDVSVIEGNSGTSIATFTVSLDKVPSSAVSFSVATANGSATAGSDYVALSLSGQTIAAGQTSKTFSVTINGDTAVEGNETFTLNASNVSGATVADGQGQGTIVNDDSAVLPALSINDVSVIEGNSGTSIATFTVSLDEVSSSAVSFSVATANGSASAGSDYVALSLSGQTIAAGQTSKTFSVTINGDTAVEGNETFTLNASNVSGATVADGEGQGTIVNDDSAVLPALSINDVSVIEGNSGTSIATFTVSLDEVSSSAVSFSVATANGSATAGSDYVALSLSGQTIAAGQTSKTFSVTINGDTAVEGNETFTLNASNVSGATVADGQGQGSIVNDDNPQALVPDISVSDASTLEGTNGNKTLAFTVQLSQTTTVPVNFTVHTAGATAFENDDFTAKSVTTSIPAGQTSYQFVVSLDTDSRVEPNENFTVNLMNVSGAFVLDAQGLGTILNDDSAQVSIAPVSVTEGNSGFVTATFQINLSMPMPTPVSFDVATGGGTATAGSDYVARSVSGMVLDAGRTKLNFDVRVNGDTLAEANETFNVTLSNISGASPNSTQATGTILNDDSAGQTIGDVQGKGQLSPLEGQQATVQGVVTGLAEDGFYLQSADGAGDGDAATSDGVFVASATSVQLGDLLEVGGTVREPADGADQLTQTRLVAVALKVLASGQALPAATAVDVTRLAGETVTALERYEGMRVSLPQLQVVAPVGGRVNESTGAVQSNGRFYAVAKGLARPFVEPGLSVFDRASRAGVSPVQFDANPERLMIESLGLRGARALSADTGDTVTGLAGILGYGAGAYRLLPEPNGTARIVSGAAPRAVSATAAGQASIGSFDLRRLLDDRRDGSEPVLAAEAYAIRLAKTANAICAYAKTPDVLGIAGIEGKAALADLASAVNANVGNELFPGACKGDAGYRGYLLAGTDSRQRNIGFLVSARVKVGAVAQIGAAATFRNRDGSAERLNERPSLVLEGSIDGVALTVVANHLAALEGDLAAPGAKGWATQGDYLRAKRAAQAAYLASWIQTRQASRPAGKLVVMGAFNASEFNDGHADLLGMVTGRPTARGRVLAYLGSPVTQPLTNLTTGLPRAERYTVTRDGNAQAVDHILVNTALLSANAKAEVARINADFGEEYLDDAGVPMRVSDHDPVVLRFDLH